jgi:hypothetical protein
MNLLGPYMVQKHLEKGTLRAPLPYGSKPVIDWYRCGASRALVFLCSSALSPVHFYRSISIDITISPVNFLFLLSLLIHF